MNYYKRHIGDYSTDASHLSLIEHGVYTVLMDAYYKREHGPTKVEAIRWTRAKSDEEIAAVETILSEFFTESEGRYQQRRVEGELATFREKQEANRLLGAKGGQANAKRNAKRMGSETLSESEAIGVANEKPSHKPLANSHKKEESRALVPQAARFTEFWIGYPVKKGKAAAEKAWKALAPDDALALSIIHALGQQRSLDADWAAGFVPHASTYLNGRRWEDEIRSSRDAPAQPSKTLRGIQALGEIANAMANGGNQHRLPEIGVSRIGSTASDGCAAGDGAGMDRSAHAQPHVGSNT